MPESKKLSELIEELTCRSSDLREWLSREYTARMVKDGQEIIDEIKRIKNQIDQKFEELRCNKMHLAEPVGVGSGLLKFLQEEKESKKWKEIDKIICDRIRSEYEKHSELLPDEIWIIIAAKKIISSLKEYGANSTENP